MSTASLPRTIDTHAHLDDKAFSADRAAVLARMFAESIGAICVGASVPSSRDTVRLARNHRHLWATVGVHPHDARLLDRHALDELGTWLDAPRVVGVGEIGLDYYRDLSPRPKQREALRLQLMLARARHVPVVLHVREATSDLISILRDTAEQHHGVVHSFLGDLDAATRFLELGLHLGVGGPLTFARNGALREAVSAVPLECLLVETDCPYLTPVPHRGHRNEPSYVRLVVEEIARLREAHPAEIAAATTANALRLFDLTDAGDCLGDAPVEPPVATR